jgi:alcohol dehydrogenase
MKALSLEAPKQWKRIDVPAPDKPGAGEALVRVHQVGICGTDLSGYLGKMPFFSYPRIPGHELGVEVVAVGPGVTNVRPGDRCSVEPYINCQKCYACVRGHTNCCEKHQTLGVHCDGGLRARFLVLARKLHVSRKLAFEQLALVETLAIGCHATNRAAPQPGESCLIIGAGPIGLATLEFVKLTGAKVIVLDVTEQRLEFCRKVMGVAHTIKLSDNIEKELRDLTDGHLPDAVIDATGHSGSMSNAFGLITHGGRLVFVGITTDEVRFRHPVFHRPEGTLLCSRNALSADFTRIIGLIEQGRIDTRPWITHRTVFEELIDVFPSYTRPETGVIKAVVAIRDDVG